MPAARGRVRERPAQEEVRRRWVALSPRRRQAVLRFDDPGLLGKIREALATLYERQSVMKALGLSPGGSDDPLEDSVLLKQGFEFSWTASRSKSDPSMVMLDPEMRPVLVAKADFASREDFLDQISSVLPDFLSQRSPRPPVPRAKWKDIWAMDPANVAEMEQQLARLVEQALWSMASDPAFGVEEQAMAEAGPIEVELEPWMEEHDARVKKAAARRKGRKARAPPLELVKEEGRAEPVVLTSHYWGVETRAEARDDRGREEEAQGAAAAAAATEAAAPAQGPPAQAEGEEEATARRAGVPTPTPTPRGGAEEDEEADGDDDVIVFGTFGVSTPPSEEGEAKLFVPSQDCDGLSKASAGTQLLSETPSRASPTKPTSGADWQPNQVVRYVWGQLAQSSNKREMPLDWGSSEISTAGATSSTGTPQRRGLGLWVSSASATSTPDDRRPGLWVSSASATSTPDDRFGKACFRAVVRNTFIDVEQRDDCTTPGSRTSRSLSPSLLRREPRAAPEVVDASRNTGEDVGGFMPGRGEEGDAWYWYTWH